MTGEFRDLFLFRENDEGRLRSNDSNMMAISAFIVFLCQLKPEEVTFVCPLVRGEKKQSKKKISIPFCPAEPKYAYSKIVDSVFMWPAPGRANALHLVNRTRQVR